jgi:hypothetical protein
MVAIACSARWGSMPAPTIVAIMDCGVQLRSRFSATHCFQSGESGAGCNADVDKKATLFFMMPSVN